VLYASLILEPGTFNTLSGTPTEIQLFPGTSFGTGAITVKSPQLSVSAVSLTDAGTAQIVFSKKAIFATVDPAQRPV